MVKHMVMSGDGDSYVVTGTIDDRPFQCPSDSKSPPLTIEQAKSVMECLDNAGTVDLSIKKVRIHRTEHFSNISMEHMKWIYTVSGEEDS